MKNYLFLVFIFWPFTLIRAQLYAPEIKVQQTPNNQVEVGSIQTPTQLKVYSNTVTNRLISSGLHIGQYGQPLSGDANPFTISSESNLGSKDLTLYGPNSGSTLHLRLFDGDLKFGAEETPNAIITNTGFSQFTELNLKRVGNGATLLTFSTERPWSFIQYSTGAGTALGLKSSSYGKWFYILSKDNLPVAGFFTADVSSNDKVNLLPNGGRVSIGLPVNIEPNATLHIRRGDAPGGTAAFSGSNRSSHFNYSTAEDTYIRGGKTTSNVFLNDTGGSVCVGTTDPQGFTFRVNGTVKVTSIKSDSGATWPDFVFYKNYKLNSLREVEQFVQSHGHLPDIPSEAEVKKHGINLAEMDAKLLQKIEELTLYLIEQNKKIDQQQQEIQQLREELNKHK